MHAARRWGGRWRRLQRYEAGRMSPGRAAACAPPSCLRGRAHARAWHCRPAALHSWSMWASSCAGCKGSSGTSAISLPVPRVLCTPNWAWTHTTSPECATAKQGARLQSFDDSIDDDRVDIELSSSGKQARVTFAGEANPLRRAAACQWDSELRHEAGAAAPEGTPGDLAVRHAPHISAHGAPHSTVALVDAYRGAVGACHVSAAAGVVRCIRRSTSQQHTEAQQAGMVARVHAGSGLMQHRSGDAQEPVAVGFQARLRLVCLKMTR